MATEIKTCDNANCKSDYQDKKYGSKKRVFNLGGGTQKGARCTVCGTKK